MSAERAPETSVEMTEAYTPQTDQAGTVTSFIALPTVFTPPSSCSTIYRLNRFSLVAYDPGFGIDIDTRVQCVPAAVTTCIGPLACPDRWTTVATSIKDNHSTLAMCCPPDYTLANGLSGSIMGDCRSNLLTDAVITYASTHFTNRQAWTMATTTIARPTYVGAIAILGWTLDLAASETVSATATSYDGTTATTVILGQVETATNGPLLTTTIPNPFPTTTRSALKATESSAVSGLPLPTAIGIGVGAGAVVISLAALAFYLWRRRRKQQCGSEAPPISESDPSIMMEPDKYSYATHYHELYGQQHERHQGPTEMFAPQTFAELDANVREKR
ncbi:hypothetical protein CDEST_07908 [Colletotrichum destructivum]|uniref:Uncharacterized protein n=1 Tax=Colletotrichum destructivum TaxID=34406 RepID=A0AAX4IHR7_9PEZI|nr:hypothetical protein CDEST_07908 [Colletotrichum destructivum]